MIITCIPSYPYWIVSREWNQPCRDGIPIRRSHYKFFLIGNVFEYLSSCPTHTPHLLFFRILFNPKFVVAGFDFAVYKEFTLNKQFPKKKNYLLASYTLECRYDLKAAAHTVSDCDFKLQEMKCGIVGVWIQFMSMCLFLSFLALFFLSNTVNSIMPSKKH